MPTPGPLNQAERNTLLITKVCPDCGGPHLLRGPHCEGVENLTCGDCSMNFRITGDLAVERTGLEPARAAFHTASGTPRECDFCHTTYTGRGVYCCMACAIDDA
jgi:hypothetical protein